MKLKHLLFYICLLGNLSACHYKPFIGYKLNKKGFKHFSKKEKFAGDNSNLYRNYDVIKYNWNIEVFPDAHKIMGNMIITFKPTKSQTTFIFDFQAGMKILDSKSSKNNYKLKRKNDLIFLIYDKPINIDDVVDFKIEYIGKPKNIVGEGPIQWKQDNEGRHWISTMTEGLGPHFIMPCNALLRDEPDTTEINITVPEDLIVTANGRLIEVLHQKQNNTKTFKHIVTNPINIYNISFNIGHFISLKKRYVDIEGQEHFIDCQVLDYHKEIADKFYDQTPIIMHEFEKMFGLFPWWNDGCRFIESTFEAMEHQSGIAMGSDYSKDWKEFNLTLVHELAHEWWGNNVTAYDYCDAWIHEGLATYAEALFIEKIYGKADYNKKILNFYNGTENKIPVKKICNVLYSSWISYDDMDIYDKGALIMHNLRVLVNNDDLFFLALKSFQQNMRQKNINSDDFISTFNSLLKSDYTSMFNYYLNEIDPPYLLYYFNYNDLGEKQFNYKWNSALQFNLSQGIVIEVNEKKIILQPNLKFQSIPANKVEFKYAESIYFLVERVKQK